MTLCFSTGPNPHNHLSMGPGLQRLMGHSCTGRSGKRVNATCAHISAAIKALCIPGSYRPTKKHATKLGDISRPDGEQPRSSGPPATATTFPTSGATMVLQASLLLLVVLVAGEGGSSPGAAPGGVCQADGCDDLQVVEIFLSTDTCTHN